MRTLGDDGSPAREKGLAGAFAAVMIGAVVWPVAQNWRDQKKDSFPLSYYPMFSLKRADATTVRYLVGVDARGGRHLIPHTYAGTGGLNQVRRQINRIVREGRSRALCERVADEVARRNEARFADVVTVQVVVGRYRLADYFADKRGSVWERLDASLVREDVAAACPVDRGSCPAERPALKPAEGTA